MVQVISVSTVQRVSGSVANLPRPAPKEKPFRQDQTPRRASQPANAPDHPDEHGRDDPAHLKGIKGRGMQKNFIESPPAPARAWLNEPPTGQAALPFAHDNRPMKLRAVALPHRLAQGRAMGQTQTTASPWRAQPTMILAQSLA
jgi:hypothetical protein